MSKKVLSFLLTLCVILTFSGCNQDAESAPDLAEPSSVEEAPDAAAVEEEPDLPAPEESEPEPELSQREQEWKEDLDYFRAQYKAKHPKPFYICSEEEFNWQLDQLAAKSGELSDSDIFYELQAIVAGMGDIHTQVEEPEFVYSRVFPVSIRYFGEKPYLTAYLEGYEQFAPYMLREIVAVNGVDMNYIRSQFERVIDPYNSWNSKETFRFNKFLPAFFDWAGCDHQAGYTFQILNENQVVESVEIPAISWEEFSAAAAWVKAESLETVSYLKHQNFVEYVSGENGGCIYMSFADMSELSSEPYLALLEQAGELIEAHPETSKLVIDLRDNYGGSDACVPMLTLRIAALQSPSIQHTYLLTSGLTASAGITALSFFWNNLDAVLVGEPTGQTTFSFGYSTNPVPIILPHSQFAIYVSSNWFNRTAVGDLYAREDGTPFEWANTILPDIFVYQDIEDLRQGKDTVMEWVLNQ